MVATTLLPFCCWLLAAVTCALPADQGFMSSYTVEGQGNAKYMFLFGDSYTRVAFDPAGEAPSSFNIIGNPAWPGASTSGGLNWATLLASQYNHSLTLVYDYAFGGATMVNEIILPPGGVPLRDLNNQTLEFQAKMIKNGAPRWAEPNRALFAVWFGQNDVYELYNHSVINPGSYMDAEFAVHFERMNDLYHYGARNFLWIGVSPLQRSPKFLDDHADPNTVKDFCWGYNERLQRDATRFASTHPGITWWYYDPAPAFHRVLDDPHRYGAPNNTCTNGDGISCLWWNDIHPGLRIHEQVAADIAASDTVRAFFRPSI